MTKKVVKKTTELSREKYNLICEEIEKYEKLRSVKYKTNCKFMGSIQYSYENIDLKQCSSISTLIEVFAVIKRYNDSYLESAKILGIENPPAPLYLEYPIKDWEHDIKLKITHLDSSLTDRLRKLRKWKEKFTEFLSEDDKMDALMKEFKEDFN